MLLKEKKEDEKKVKQGRIIQRLKFLAHHELPALLLKNSMGLEIKPEEMFDGNTTRIKLHVSLNGKTETFFLESEDASTILISDENGEIFDAETSASEVQLALKRKIDH